MVKVSIGSKILLGQSFMLGRNSVVGEVEDQTTRSKPLEGYHLQKKGRVELVIGGSLCLGQEVLVHLVKLLKEESLTGFCLGYPPTSSVCDLRVIVLVIS